MWLQDQERTCSIKIWLVIRISIQHLIHIRHCVKSVQIRSFSGLFFLVFGLNTKIYFVSLHIQSKYGKLRTKKTPHLDTFPAVRTSTQHLIINTIHQLVATLSFYFLLINVISMAVTEIKKIKWLEVAFMDTALTVVIVKAILWNSVINVGKGVITPLRHHIQ